MHLALLAILQVAVSFGSNITLQSDIVANASQISDFKANNSASRGLWRVVASANSRQAKLKEDLVNATEVGYSRSLLNPRDDVDELGELSSPGRRLFWGGRRRRRIGKVFKKIGKGIVKVGHDIGKVTKSLPSSVAKAAKTVGRATVKLGRLTAFGVKDLGNKIKNVVKNLAGSVDRVAKEGAKLTKEIGKEMSDKVKSLGTAAEKLGSVVIGIAKDAWDGIKDFFACLSPAKLLCPILLPGCDCNAGSHASIDFSSGTLRAKCVAPVGDFAKSFGLSAAKQSSFGRGDKTSNMKAKLPGGDKVGPRKGKLATRRQQTTFPSLSSKLTKAPAGSCEGDLSLALDAEAELEPVIDFEVGVSGSAKVKVGISSSVTLNALVEAYGECNFAGERRFPKVPKMKVACAGYFCIAIMVQAVAKIDVKGMVTGSIGASVAADFGVSAEVSVNLLEKDAEVTVEATEFNHDESLSFAASMGGVVTIGLGPHLVIWPMPGVPIDFLPTVNAEVRGLGTLDWNTQTSSSKLLNTSHASTALLLSSASCAAAALNVFAVTDVHGFGLPAALEAGLSTDWLKDAVASAILEGATAMMDIVLGPLQCIPGGNAVSGVVTKAAEAAASKVAGVIPSLDISLAGLTGIDLANDELFCKQLIRTPNAGACTDGVSCDAE